MARTVLGWLCLLALAPPVAADREWLPAGPDYTWSFPRDHWAHPGYRTEWWYFTGHLRTGEPVPRRLAYQFTFFRIGILADAPGADSDWAATDLVMAHAAVCEIDAGQRRFSELLYRAVPLLGGFPAAPGPGTTEGDRAGPAVVAGRLAWSRAPAGTDTVWALHWDGEGFVFCARDDARGLGFSLRAVPERPLVLQGPNGYSRKGAGEDAASLYYSFTRLVSEGTVCLDGRTVPVAGRSWMDKEFGSGLLARHQAGWDWFSLQLDDGRDLMLYLLRDRSGGVDVARGTLLDASGSVRYLDADEISIRSDETWRSPATGAVYPSRWTIVVAGARPPLVLEVAPLLADQENRGTLAGGIFYWEGAVEALDEGGACVGLGFVELTGYGSDNRPALAN